MPTVSTSRVLLAIVAIAPCLVLLAPVAVIVLPLLAIAACARAIGRALEARHVPWSDLMQFDPQLGWKPRPQLDARYLAEGDDVFHVETDADGWPGRRTIAESDVVAVGDSFAFGYGVHTAQSFAARSTACRVKAIGAPGYSMVHGVLLMEQLADRLRGKLIVWLVYLENDLQDNLAPEMRQYRAPFVRRAPDGWHIEDRHLSSRPWRCSDLDRRRLFARFCVPGPLAERAFSAADYLIGRAQAVCCRAGARLVIITVPHATQLTASGQRELAAASGDPARCDAGLPDAELARSCRQHQVQMIAGREHLRAADYKQREGIHWTVRGHRRMAALIDRLAAGSPLTTAARQPGRESGAVPDVVHRATSAAPLATGPSRSATT